jgi:hypothetical protein
VADRRRSQTRDKKLENLIMNHSMIFMGMFEEAFSDIADRMTEALAEGGAAIADALRVALPPGTEGPGTADIGERLRDGIAPDVRMQIEHMFAGIRDEIASQWPKNGHVFKQYVSSPAFDKGIEIVEKHDFGRPKLTEKLSDEVLVSYVFLLQSGDKEMGRMFRELADWQSGLPKPPWAM